MIAEALKLKLILLNILGANLVYISREIKPVLTPVAPSCKEQKDDGIKLLETSPKDTLKLSHWLFKK